MSIKARLGKILQAFAAEMTELESKIIQIINERVPGLSNELLPEWERDLGLPDECSELATTQSERVAAVHAKYYGKYDGQSKEFYEQYAADLGATVTIEDYTGSTNVFRVDISRVDRHPTQGIDGARLRSKGSIFKWIVNVYNTGEVSIDYLICRFDQMKPAHTQVIWNDLT